MRPKAYFDPHILRFAGLFNLPIFLHFVMKIGVSRYKKKLTITPPSRVIVIQNNKVDAGKIILYDL
jgi:hypothetical protein